MTKTMDEVLAAALYRLEWDADLYATPRGQQTERYERHAATLTAAGFGLVADAKAEALESAAADAEGMHEPVAPECKEWADWIRARAKAERKP